MDLNSREQFINIMRYYSENLKITDKTTSHSYERVYSDILVELKDRDNVNILDIGVAEGGSVKIWEDCLPKANIYGVDINYTKVSDKTFSDRVHFYTGRQDNPDTFIPLKGIMFDMIIDDASHQVRDQIASFNIMKNQVKIGGYYIIEDIYPQHTYPNDFMDLFKVIDMTNIPGKHGDNKLFVYHRT